MRISPWQIPGNRQGRGFPHAGSSRLCLAVLSLCAIHALRLLRGEPPLIDLSFHPGNCELSWTPQPESANFLQISDNLLDWRYHSLTLPGGSPMRTLDFPQTPGTPGSRFFRAVASPYPGNDPDSEDFDADGLSTREELLIFGTDPLVRDTDGDGVADGGGDSDLDGLPDAVEIRAGLDIHDPADASGDLDHDGISNLTEATSGTDPANRDTDHDGLGDAWERLHGDPPVPDNNHVPWKVNDRGQVAFLNYNQDGLLLWNGSSLVTVAQAHPGFLLISDLDSSGRLVGQLDRLVIDGLTSRRAAWAFHADIGAARLTILKPDVPDLYQTWESFAWGVWGPEPRNLYQLNQSTLTHIAENGTAWGVRDGFQIVATASPYENRRNYLTEMVSGIPSAYQTSSGTWSTLPGNSAAFAKFSNGTLAVGPVGAINVPAIISPDASHWLLSIGARSINVGTNNYSTKTVTRLEARPDIKLPAQLPAAAVAITDAGELAGSGGFSPYNPYFCKDTTLVRFAAMDQVMGIANRKTGQPTMVLGKKGVWLQRPDEAEYRAYNDVLKHFKQ